MTPLDIRDYGADPTGTVDSTGAIQNAINDVANGLVNGPILVPTGTFLVEGQLIVPHYLEGSRTVTDATVTSGSPTVTSTQANFQSSDVGAFVVGYAIPAGTIITAVNPSLHTATMSNNATATGGPETVMITTSDPLQRAVRITGASTGLFDGYGASTLRMTYSGRTFVDGSVTDGSATLTSASGAQFTIADIGRFVAFPGESAPVISGAVIVSVQSPTQATMSFVAGATASGLTVNLSGPKLLTTGLGVLSIEHLLLHDTGSDSAPFIQTTNTTIRVSDVTFVGTSTARLLENVTTNSGSTTVTLSTGSFSASDVGAAVFGIIPGPGTSVIYRGTVINSQSGTSCVLSTAASASSTTATIAVCSSYQDAIVFGGTSDFSDGTANSQFQGYGSVIEKCYFVGIRRGGFFRASANTIVFRDNSFNNSCGGGWQDAAIDLDGQSASFPNGAVGNMVSGNLVEGALYGNILRLNRAFRNFIIGNTISDALGGAQYSWYLLANSANNLVVGSPPIAFYEANPTNTLINPGSSGQFSLTDGASLNLGPDSPVGFFGATPSAQLVVSGSRSSATVAVLTSLLAALGQSGYGLIDDNTTA